MNIKACLTSNNQNWATPLFMYEIISACGLDDVCPLNSEFDAFKLESWFKRSYCNPPYNNIDAFVDRAIIEMKKGNKILFLVPARTDTQWFKKLYENNAQIFFIEGRLHFNEGKSAPFPSMIALLTSYNYLPSMDYIRKNDISRVLAWICSYLI